MSRGSNQKFKFTYLMKVMLEKTDDEHALTMSQIMDELEKYDVTAEQSIDRANTRIKTSTEDTFASTIDATYATKKYIKFDKKIKLEHQSLQGSRGYDMV